MPATAAAALGLAAAASSVLVALHRRYARSRPRCCGLAHLGRALAAALLYGIDRE